MTLLIPLSPAHRRVLAVGLLVWCLPPRVPAQENAPSSMQHFVFLPGHEIVQPLTAADQEPRVGIRKEAGSSRLTLDIGAVLDVVAYRPDQDEAGGVRAGIDFFTYALSTSTNGHRLQIDAVDGFFGGHITYRRRSDASSLSIRLRILHRSAHFVDGHYDNGTGTWRNGQEPIPFTKDFGELLVSPAWSLGPVELLPYAGVSYTTLIRPDDMKRLGALTGIEATSGTSLGSAFGRPFALFAAYNLSLDGIPVYVGTNTVMAGAKFGEWTGQGIRLIVSYRNGLEMFGQYYASRRSYWSVGFLFDVW